MSAAPRAAEWEGVRLHIVTGKGGTGKTTVAAALALALAAGGKRVLLAEVEGRQGISQALDVPPLADREVRVAHVSGGGEVWGLAVDAKAALMEYLQLFYTLGRAGGGLERFGAIDFATTIAPGVRDVLLIGKVYEAVRRRRDPKSKDPRAARLYDAVVLDAPPTGRVVRFLGVNEEVAGLARVGPIRSQADSITALLRSRQVAVHVVALLEEMPVQEAVDAAAELPAAGFSRGAVVVNQVRSAELDDDELAAARDGALDDEAIAAELAEAGVRPRPSLVNGLLEETSAYAGRLALERREAERLETLGRTLYRLPFLPEGVDAGGVRSLAHDLAEQGLA